MRSQDGWTGSFLVALLLLCSACAERAARDDSDGREGRTGSIGSLLVLGDASGEGPQGFGQVTDLALDRHGTVYVLDGHAREVRVFDSDGAFVRSVGRAGEGPGELRSVLGIAVDDQDLIWVVDPGNGRYTLFNATGAFIRSHPRPLAVVLPFRGGISARGLYDVDLGSDEDRLSLIVVRFDPQAATFDTVGTWSNPHNDASAPLSFRLLLFLPRVTVGVDRSGTVYGAYTGEYRIEAITGTGERRVFARDVRPQPVTPSMKDSIVALARPGEPPIERAQIPDRLPFFRSVLPAENGRILVMISEPDGQIGRVFDVFDANGRYQGQLLSEFRLDWTPVPRIVGDRILGVTRDSLDVPYVVLGEIRWP